MTLEKGDSLIGDILLTKRAALLSPHLAAIANDGRRGLDERIAAAESAMVMSVALSQPHRRGANPAAECLSEPLGRFCLNHKPKPLGERTRGFRRTAQGVDRQTSRSRAGSPGPRAAHSAARRRRVER